MKILNYLIAALFVSASFGAVGQTKVDVDKSTLAWVGKKIGGEHSGNINLKSGSLVEKNGKIESGNFVIDMSSITNTDMEDPGYQEKLVGHLKSDDFFGVNKYPTASLKITSSSKFNNGKATVMGLLTIKGITEKIEFEVSKKNAGYIAEIAVDRSKYNVRYGSDSFFDDLGDKVIDDIFNLTVSLTMLGSDS